MWCCESSFCPYPELKMPHLEPTAWRRQTTNGGYTLAPGPQCGLMMFKCWCCVAMLGMSLWGSAGFHTLLASGCGALGYADVVCQFLMPLMLTCSNMRYQWWPLYMLGWKGKGIAWLEINDFPSISFFALDVFDSQCMVQSLLPFIPQLEMGSCKLPLKRNGV